MIYKSSRLTSGNRIFRTSLDVEGHQITYRKRRWFGSTEETINVDHISSVRAQHGVMFSSITIESSGGSQPIQIFGLRKSDANDIETAIKLFRRSEMLTADGSQRSLVTWPAVARRLSLIFKVQLSMVLVDCFSL